MDGGGDRIVRGDSTAGPSSSAFSFNLNESSFGGGRMSMSNFSFVDRSFGGRGVEDSSMMSVQTTASQSHGLVRVPGELHGAFYRALQKMGSRLQVFEVVDEWMLQLESAIGKSTESFDGKVGSLLRMEWETWDLIRSLYFPRLSEDDSTDSSDNLLSGLKKVDIHDEFHLDDATHVDAILRESKDLQEMKVILGWLEINYARRVGEPSVEAKDIAWEHTLDTLKKDAAVGKKNPALVTSIDPDAVSRTGKALHPLDAAEEERIMRGVFSYLRRGNPESAMAFLVEAGHPAKAFALFGATRASLHKLSFDEEDEEEEDPPAMYAGLPKNKVGVREDHENPGDGGEYPPESGLAPKVHPEFRVAGNSMRDLWQSVAWEICESKDNLSKFDRAAYAALLPHTGVLLEVSNSWEDKLWARVKGAVETRLEEELRASHVDKGKWETLPSEFWAQGQPLGEILRKVDIDVAKNRNVEGDDESNFSAAFLALQKAVMVNDVEEFLNFMTENIEQLLTVKDSDGDDEVVDHFVRFLIHVLLFFAIVDLPYSDTLTNIAAEAFIRVLVRGGDFDSTPFYVQKLSGDEVQAAVVASQIDVLMAASGSEDAGHLRPEEIRSFLLNCQHNELPLLLLCSAVVDKYREDAAANGAPFPVQTLEWLRSCVDLAENAEDAVAALVALLRAVLGGARSFLMSGEVDKAGDVVALVTPQDLNDLVSVAPQTTDTIVREFVCYKELLEAEKAYSLWRKSVGSKPTSTRGGVTGGGDADRVWSQATSHHAKMAVEAMLEVLKFPGGWLKDVYTAEGDEDDALAVDAVRRVVLKKVVFVVLNLLTVAEGFESFPTVRAFTRVLVTSDRAILHVLSVEDIRAIFSAIEAATRKAEPNLLLLPK